MMISIRAGSRRSHDRGGSGDIECQRHESSGVSREGGGKYKRGDLPSNRVDRGSPT